MRVSSSLLRAASASPLAIGPRGLLRMRALVRCLEQPPAARRLHAHAQPESGSSSFSPPVASPVKWRSTAVLDSYVEKDARPISLRQLIFFGGRNLDEKRILNSANYVRTELPVRLAHRIRDMQKLPYVVVTNRHLSHVYELYYKAFDAMRQVPEMRTLKDNDRFCKVLKGFLQEHLTVIPRLAMGVQECRSLLPAADLDRFMSSLLRSRISRRVIAEQHLALTETFNSPFHFPDAHPNHYPDTVGEVFLRCNAHEVVSRVGKYAQDLARAAYGASSPVPEIKIEGHLNTVFPYILSQLEYIIGELLRNSIQSTIEVHGGRSKTLPPITVLICHAPKHVIFRVSDQGGGVPPEELADIWSFSKGTHADARVRNFEKVPKMAATFDESAVETLGKRSSMQDPITKGKKTSSLSSLTSRPPDLRLGIGLPMSRVYAEYWAGSLELHSLEGYGTDAFLQIEKLGNKSEQLNNLNLDHL